MPLRIRTVLGWLAIVVTLLACGDDDGTTSEPDASAPRDASTPIDASRPPEPDASIALDFMLHRFAGLVEKLVVYPERMRENLESSRGLVFSGSLLLLLAEKGLAREDAYALVQGHAMDTWEKGGQFRDRVLGDPEIARVLAKEEIERAFDLDAALRNVDAIFARTLQAPAGRAQRAEGERSS